MKDAQAGMMANLCYSDMLRVHISDVMHEFAFLAVTSCFLICVDQCCSDSMPCTHVTPPLAWTGRREGEVEWSDESPACMKTRNIVRR